MRRALAQRSAAGDEKGAGNRVEARGGREKRVGHEDARVVEVYLQPGEMVLYEGARIKHGRPMRFKGEIFGNIFTHFAPIDYIRKGSRKDLLNIAGTPVLSDEL